MRVAQGQENSIDLDDLPKRDRDAAEDQSGTGDAPGPSTYPPESPPGYYPAESSSIPPNSIDEALDQEPLLAENRRLPDDTKAKLGKWTSFVPRRMRPIAIGLLLILGTIFIISLLSCSRCYAGDDIVEARRKWAIDREKYDQETR